MDGRTHQPLSSFVHLPQTSHWKPRLLRAQNSVACIVGGIHLPPKQTRCSTTTTRKTTPSGPHCTPEKKTTTQISTRRSRSAFHVQELARKQLLEGSVWFYHSARNAIWMNATRHFLSHALVDRVYSSCCISGSRFLRVLHAVSRAFVGRRHRILGDPSIRATSVDVVVWHTPFSHNVARISPAALVYRFLAFLQSLRTAFCDDIVHIHFCVSCTFLV